MARWTVGAARNLPILMEESWDGDAARAEMFGGDDNPNWDRARRGHLVYDAEEPELKGSYKLPFARVRDGRLMASSAGVRAAASRLPQTDIPAEAKQRARAVLDGYQARIRRMRGAGGKALPGWIGEPVKALGGHRFGGYGVLWGSPDQRDLVGEWFAPDTEELDVVWRALGRIPALYSHAGDDLLKSAPVGVIDVMSADEVGLWVEGQLDLHNKYLSAIQELMERGVLFFSSGTFPRARRVGKDGKILRWPIIEVSLTPAPAEPRMLDVPVQAAKDYYNAIGLASSQVDDILERFDPEAAAKGGEDPRPDAEAERIAQARLRLLKLYQMEV